MQFNEHQKQNVPWSVHDVWMGMAAFCVWVFVGVGLSIQAQKMSWSVSLDLRVLVAVLWVVPLLVPTWWFTIKKYQVRFEALGFRTFEWKWLGIGFGWILLFFAFNISYNLLLLHFDLQPQQVVNVEMFRELSSPWPFVVGAIILAPVIEELFFRSFVFAGLRNQYGWFKAALINSALFAFMHFLPLAFIPYFVIGFLLTYLYQRSQSIWPPILMHALVNLIGVGMIYLQLQLNS